MREQFARTLGDLAERDPRIVLLTGDLGYTVLEPFAERFPERFYNAGVAEQNMVGLATGLAEAGFIPFVYSIATFATMRPYEFIRNGAIVHELPVRIVGVGGGFDYGAQGISHYALEDVGILRVQPELTIVAPADRLQARSALEQTWELPRPIYFRIAKASSEVTGLDGWFELGRAAVLGDGSDVAIVALGTAAAEAIAAAEALAHDGVEATVAVVSSLNPSPIDDLADLLGRVPLALTVEAHYAVGGVGSLASEIVAERGLDCRVVRCAVEATPRAQTGSRESLHEAHGLTADALVRAARAALVDAR